MPSSAVTGAALGEHRGNAAAGAVLGTAIGAVGGAAIGSQIDENVARSEAIIEQRMGRRLLNAVTVEEVIALSGANLSDEVIQTHINSKGLARPVEVNDLIAMRDAGVSDGVIQQMQKTGSAATRPVSYPAPRTPPVIIEEHHFAPPVYIHDHHRPPVYCPPVRRRHRGHSGFHFSIGH